MAKPFTEDERETAQILREAWMGRRVTNALAPKSLPEPTLKALAAQLKVSSDQVAFAVTDPQRIERELNAASPACLVLLEALLESGGQMLRPALRTLLHVRFEWSEAQFDAAFAEGASRNLFLIATLTRHYGNELECVFVLDEMSHAMANLVMGITLPRAPASSVAKVSPTGATSTLLRDRLARTAATLHFTVKASRGGADVNRSTIRKLAAATCVPENSLHQELQEALRNGSVRAVRDLVVPSVPTLRALAAHTATWSATAEEAKLRAWVGSEGWVSEEALTRALAIDVRPRAQWPLWVSPYEFNLVGGPEFAVAADLVAATDFLRIVHEGETFVHGHVHEENQRGDGHVTPSLEVMLGPEANLDLTVTIALSAEPVRFDRVLTFKLTQASVSSAASLGLDGPTILDALKRVGPHPVPRNVISMVEDWAHNARSARIQAAWVVELSSSEAADIASRALGKNVIARPTPTLLLIDKSLSSPESVLAKIGIRIKDTGAEGGGLDALMASMKVAASPVLAISPPDVRRDKVAKATKEGFTLGAAVLPESDEIADDPPMRPWLVLFERAKASRNPSMATFLEVAAQRIQKTETELSAWLMKLPASEREEAMHLMEMAPLALLAIACVPAKERTRQLRAYTSITSLLLASNRTTSSATVEGSALPIWNRLQHPEAAALLEADLQCIRGETTPAALAPMRTKPTLAQLPAAEARVVLAQIKEAMEDAKALWMHVSSKVEGDYVVLFLVERLVARGNETLVLGIDLDADEDRSFPLSSLKSVRQRVSAPQT